MTKYQRDTGKYEERDRQSQKDRVRERSTERTNRQTRGGSKENSEGRPWEERPGKDSWNLGARGVGAVAAQTEGSRAPETHGGALGTK